MRAIHRSVLVLLAGHMLSSSPAFAEPIAFEAVLRLVDMQGVPEPGITATGVATVNGSAGGTHVNSLRFPAGVFMGTTNLTTSTSPSPTFPVTRIDITFSNALGSFAGGAPLAGEMAIPGNLRVCLLTCSLSFNIPLTQSGTRGVGQSGPGITQNLGAFGNLTLQGAPWTTGSVSAATTSGVISLAGFAHGPASLTSSTAQAGGVLQLVTPINIAVSTLVGTVNAGALGLTRIHFAPEPTRAALLVAGGAFLFFLAKTRRR